MISLAFTAAAGVLLVVAVIARFRQQITSRQFYVLVGTATGINLVCAVAVGNTVGASINAASVAINVWLWWRDGGGDDAKRRLRKWARKFQGVRRTAPAAT